MGLSTLPTASRDDRPWSVWLLMGLLGALGVTALAGGTGLVLAPSGAFVGLSTTELAGSPFADYLIPGVVLSTVLGAFPIVVVLLLFRGHRFAWHAAAVVGVALVTWVLVQGSVIGYGERMQYPHLVQALAILVLALLDSTRKYCRSD